MSPRPRITAIVHTLNAETHLEKCLNALKPFDEVLVVDMESTDSTIEIANRCGAKVIVKPRGNLLIAEAYRDFAIHQAENPWVFFVDADEIVPKALAEYLYAEIERDPSPRAIMIPIKNYFMGRWMHASYPDYILRFFPKEGAAWPARIHSRPTHQGPKVYIPAKRTDLAVVHLANESVRRTIEKMNRYTDLETERRRGSYRAVKLFYDPPYRFFKSYVLKGGFRDGLPGFINAVHNAVYRFAILAKLEEEKQSKRPDKDVDNDYKNSL